MATIARRDHELAFRTQYAELKERSMQAGPLLPGTAGTLKLRSGTGSAYWYRVYYPVPGRQTETFVCKDGDGEALGAMRDRIAFASWCADQVGALRRLAFQVADKGVGRVLVELYNRGAFGSGLVLVGTLGVMAWLNELGVMTAASRTLDIDLGRRAPLELVSPLSLPDLLRDTGLRFAEVPGFPAGAASTSLKLRGAEDLRVDLLAPGARLGGIVRAPELQWSAQSVPYFDYLLDSPETGAALAGGHCVPVRLPQAARLVWHKLYASTQRPVGSDKATKDRRQASLLGDALAREDPSVLTRALSNAPASMRSTLRRGLAPKIERIDAGPEFTDVLREAFRR